MGMDEDNPLSCISLARALLFVNFTVGVPLFSLIFQSRVCIPSSSTLIHPIFLGHQAWWRLFLLPQGQNLQESGTASDESTWEAGEEVVQAVTVVVRY